MDRVRSGRGGYGGTKICLVEVAGGISLLEHIVASTGYVGVGERKRDAEVHGSKKYELDEPPGAKIASPRAPFWDTKVADASTTASYRCMASSTAYFPLGGAPLSRGNDSGPGGARWTLKKIISLVLTVPTATSSREGLHARQDTWLGKSWHHATGRWESVFQTATDLISGGKPSEGESAAESSGEGR